MSIDSKKVAGAALAVMLLLGTPAHAQSTQSLEAQIAALMAQINALKAQLGTGGNSSTCSFTRDLTVGSQGTDVSCLQQYLSSTGHYSFSGGATGYFGPVTASAVARWQSANGVAPAAGYFGSVSRAKFAALGGGSTGGDTSNPPSTGDQLSGGEADLSGFDLRREASEGHEGEEDVLIATAEFDVDDADVRVERLEITLRADNGSLNKQPWKYFDSIALYADGKKLAEEGADSRNDWSRQSGDDYRMTFSGLKYVVKEGKTAEIEIRADIAPSIDSADRSQTFTVFVADRGIRAADGAGIQQYTGKTSDTVTFGFAAEENGKLTVRENDDSPEASILVADADRESKDYDVFVFDLRNQQDADTMITDLAIDVTDLTSGVSATDVLRRATLEIGKKSFRGDINASSISFEDMDYEIDGDDTETATLVVRLARNATSTPIGFAVDGANIEAEGVKSGGSATVTGSIESALHSIALAGVGVQSVSTSEAVVTPGSDASAAYGTYTIKFKVTALDEDAFISTDLASTTGSTTAGVTYAIEGGSYEGSISDILTSTASKQGDFFRVREGRTETFTLTVTLNPDAAGTYKVSLGSVRFNDTADTSGSTVFTIDSRASGYSTNPLYIPN